MKKTITSFLLVICVFAITAFCSTNIYHAYVDESIQDVNADSIEINSNYISTFLEDKAYISDESEVKKLIEERNDITLSMSVSNNIEKIEMYNQRLDEIERKLISLGVTKTDKQTINNILTATSENQTNNNSRIGNPANPTDSEDVDWWTYQYKKTYGGKTYTIFEMLAQPTEVPGRLYNSVQDDSIYVQSSLFQQVVDIYLGKAISSIAGVSKILSWMPYEILFPNGTNINYSSTTHFANLRANTVMMYTFIYHEAYNAWEFMMTTHYTSVNSTTTFYLTGSHGEFESKMVEKNFNVHSDYYDNVNHALYLFQNTREGVLHINVPACYMEDGITVYVDGKSVFLPFMTYEHPTNLY